MSNKAERARRARIANWHDRQLTANMAVAVSHPSIKERKAATRLCAFHRAQAALWTAHVRRLDEQTLATERMVGGRR